MELLDPDHISAQIISLIREAQEKLIIVSPYNNFQKWHKLRNTLKAARERKVDIKFYVRTCPDNDTNVRDIKELFLEPILIDGLHLKFYINDTIGIVTTFNLLMSADINSLDIAYKTESAKEYNDLFRFYEKHVASRSKKNGLPPPKILDDAKQFLKSALTQALGSAVRVSEENDHFRLNAFSNVYNIFIQNNPQRYLNINGVLSKNQYAKMSSHLADLEKESGMTIELLKGKGSSYDLILGKSKIPLNSGNVKEIRESESSVIIEETVRFISMVRRIKAMIN